MWQLWPIPIRLPEVEIEVQADRRLAFQILTAWGVAGPDGQPRSQVLRQEKGRLLIEFHTPIKGLLGRPVVHRTVEWVTPTAPERIDFEAVEGPLPLLRDSFILEEWGPCTRMHYQSTFGVRGWVPGWLIGKLYVEPILKRFMRSHLVEMKETIEARARRSKVYPQQPCPETTRNEKAHS